MKTEEKNTFIAVVFSEKFQYLLLAVLSVFALRLGIVPAWSGIHSDFPNYYVSARLLTEGADFKRIYDDAWFNAKIKSYGIEQQGKFSPFPPATAFVMLPLAHFTPLTAKRIWTVCNLLMLLGCVWALHKITGWRLLWCANFQLLSGLALVNNFLFGQIYLLLLLSVLAGYLCLLRQRVVGAGVFWGVGAAIKYLPVVYLLGAALNRKWRTAFAGLASIGGVIAVEILVFGGELYRFFISDILLPHLDGRISAQDPYAFLFQSWNTLLRHIFVYDATANPVPFFDWQAGYRLGKMVISLTVAGLSGYAMWRLRRIDHPNRLALDVAIIGIAAMLLLPATATYHFLLLVFPVAVLLSAVRRDWRSLPQWLLISSYAAIGFVMLLPVANWELSGWQILLAFPRLWLMTLLFAAAIITVRNEWRHAV